MEKHSKEPSSRPRPLWDLQREEDETQNERNPAENQARVNANPSQAKDEEPPYIFPNERYGATLTGTQDNGNENEINLHEFSHNNFDARLLDTEMNKIGDLIKRELEKRGQRVSGLIQDYDLCENILNQSFRFDWRVVQFFFTNLSHECDDTHCVLMVRDIDQRFQLYDSLIPATTDKDYMLEYTVLSELSVKGRFTVYHLSIDEYLEMTYSGTPCPLNERPIVLEPFCPCCDEFVEFEQAGNWKCEKCRKMVHRGCIAERRPVVTCKACFDRGIVTGFYVDAIIKGCQNLDFPDKRLIYDINFGKSQDQMYSFIVQFRNSNGTFDGVFYLWDTETTGNDYHLSDDMQIAIAQLCFPDTLQRQIIEVDIMNCTQQQNNIDCCVYSALNAIHWAFQGFIPSSYLQGKTSSELRSMLKRYMESNGNLEEIQPQNNGSAMAQSIHSTVRIDTTCKKKNCLKPTIEDVINATYPDIYRKFKCYICKQWYHWFCGQLNDKKFIYRAWCDRCRDFWKLGYAETPSDIISNTTASQGIVQTPSTSELTSEPPHSQLETVQNPIAAEEISTESNLYGNKTDNDDERPPHEESALFESYWDGYTESEDVSKSGTSPLCIQEHKTWSCSAPIQCEVHRDSESDSPQSSVPDDWEDRCSSCEDKDSSD